jgi:hypothetical protein
MYTKEIAPHFEIDGKRRKLTGFDGILRDGDTVIHCREYRSYTEAETQLDLLTYELLSDHFEHGLVDALPASDDTPLLQDIAQTLDMALGSTSGAASVVAELRRVRARVAQELHTV